MRLASRIVLGCVLGICLAGSAFAQGTGRSLDIQPGGRQNGMGATGVAIAEDATGVSWWSWLVRRLSDSVWRRSSADARKSSTSTDTFVRRTSGTTGAMM